MGLRPQHMCCATTYIRVPIYQAGNALRRELPEKGEILSPSEFVGVRRRWSDDMENIEDDEDEAQRHWGARRRLYSN